MYVSLLKIFPLLFLKVPYHNHVMAMSRKYYKRRCVSQTFFAHTKFHEKMRITMARMAERQTVVTFCQINLSRVSTPALSTPALSSVHPCHLVPCCPLPRFQRPQLNHVLSWIMLCIDCNGYVHHMTGTQLIGCQRVTYSATFKAMEHPKTTMEGRACQRLQTKVNLL